MTIRESARRQTGLRIRAARALLRWSQERLAQESRIDRSTVVKLESGKRTPQGKTLDQLRGALETAGVAFTNGGEPGVNLRAVSESIRGADLNASNDK